MKESISAQLDHKKYDGRPFKELPQLMKVGVVIFILGFAFMSALFFKLAVSSLYSGQYLYAILGLIGFLIFLIFLSKVWSKKKWSQMDTVE